MKDLDYTPKQVVVSIGGKEYPVAERTERVEKAIREHDAGMENKSQFESDFALVSILLGDDAARELFPNGENENLDRLYFIATKLVEAYRANYYQIVDDNLRESANPVLEQLKELSDAVKTLTALKQGVPSKQKRE